MPKCPKCDIEMEKMEIQVQEKDRYRKVWDLGLTGSGTTTTATTSGTNYDNVTATLPPEQIKSKAITLIPYKCPKCGRQESYRE